MVAWRTAFLVFLVYSLATLVQRGSNFDLTDGDDGHQKPGTGGRVWLENECLSRPCFCLICFPNVGIKERWNHVTTTTTRRPGTTRAPSNPMEPDGFNLADALDDQNDLGGRKKPNAGEGGGFSDKDLEDILGGGGYKPDQNKGGGGYASNDDPGSGMSTETGTIAGVASALAMALIGAVSSYISYQQKKFCFSIQQGLNADYVKGENLEAVVCEEPQVTYSKQETQSAEPPPSEPPRI
ncbi:CD99 antigen-like protein 2 [Cricetulus griseus]|uniref:CD99 antigen-like protein 2 n=1 Tax=Cricetulus griseus TaxID=10029 RepID=A0A061HVH0_CRIGR|nr:CD99 antigen-like protein 2 [Cricetulus griseus]